GLEVGGAVAYEHGPAAMVLTDAADDIGLAMPDGKRAAIVGEVGLVGISAARMFPGFPPPAAEFVVVQADRVNVVGRQAQLGAESGDGFGQAAADDKYLAA